MKSSNIGKRLVQGVARWLFQFIEPSIRYELRGVIESERSAHEYRMRESLRYQQLQERYNHMLNLLAEQARFSPGPIVYHRGSDAAQAVGEYPNWR